MKKNEIINAFFSNEEMFYSFEVYPKFDEESFDEAFNNETLNNFRLVSVIKDKCQIIFETTDRAEMIAAIDKIRLK